MKKDLTDVLKRRIEESRLCLGLSSLSFLSLDRGDWLYFPLWNKKEADYLAKALEFKASLDPLKRKVFETEFLYQNLFYPFWYLPYISTKKYTGLKKEVSQLAVGALL